MIHNILLSVDGSVQVDKAITLAADLAHRYEAKITIYHVATDLRPCRRGSGTTPFPSMCPSTAWWPRRNLQAAAEYIWNFKVKPGADCPTLGVNPVEVLS